MLLSALVSCNEGGVPSDTTADATHVGTTADVTTAAHEHIWGNFTTVKRPTCAEEGIKQRSCSCGAVEEIPIDATGMHIYKDRQCINCSAPAASINSVTLDNFVIVHANNDLCKSAAESLQALLKKDMGYELPIHTQSAAESEYEIIVGRISSRPISTEFYSKGGFYTEECFEVTISGNKMAICALNAETMALALENFNDRFLSAATMHLTDSDSFSANKHAIYGRVNSTDIRIMSNNVLYSSPSEREDVYLDMLDRIDADILLLQEMSTAWYTTINGDLRQRGFAPVPTKNDKVSLATQTGNYTPIYYRTDKMELVDYGYDQFETVKLTNNTSKSYTWAVFNDNRTGKQFCVISTHFTWAEQNFDPSPDEMRRRDADEMIAFISELKAKYSEDLPIFLMGDFNFDVNSVPFSKMRSAMKYARSLATIKYKINVNYATWHELGQAISTDASAIIDHAFISGNGYEITQYQHIVNEFSVAASDHTPIVMDVDLS